MMTTTTQNQIPSKRELIVRAARHRFRKYGIRKTSMLEIATDAGMAVGTIYLYFKDKNDLVIGCSDSFAEKHQKFARKILHDPRRADVKLLEYVTHRFKAVEETRTGSNHAADIARAVMTLLPQRAEEDRQWLYDTVLALLNEGAEQGIFRIATPQLDAEVFVESIQYFLPWAHKQPYKDPTLEKLLLITNWFIEKWLLV